MSSERELNEARAALLAIAESKQVYLQRAYIEAIGRVRDLMTLQELENALLNGDLYAIQRAYGSENVQPMLAGFKDALTNTYAFAGGKLASEIPTTSVYFNQVNPRLVEVVNQWSNTLITNETQATIQSIGKSLGQATIQGINPKTAAVRFRGRIGLTDAQQSYLANYERQLRTNDPRALDRALRDKRQDAGTLKAIRNNTPMSEADVQKRVQRYEERMLKYRAETIARTESLRMTNMANQHIYDNAVEEGSIQAADYRRFWVNTKDTRTRDAHVSLPSMNPLGVALNEPFKSTLGNIMYPHDPNASAGNTVNCRCTLVYKLQASLFG